MENMLLIFSAASLATPCAFDETAATPHDDYLSAGDYQSSCYKFVGTAASLYECVAMCAQCQHQARGRAAT